MMNMNGLDLSRPVFVCDDRDGGDVMLVRFIDEVFVYVRQCLVEAGCDANAVCGGLGTQWRDYRRDDSELEQENEQPMTPHARRNNLIRLAMIAELLVDKKVKKNWVGCGYLGTGYLNLGAFAGVLDDIYGVSNGSDDVWGSVLPMLKPGFVEEVKKALGPNIFNIPRGDGVAQARLWQLLGYVGKNVDVHLPETPSAMLAVWKHFVDNSPYSNYPGLKEQYRCILTPECTILDVLNMLYTRHCVSQVTAYADIAPARARLRQLLVQCAADEALAAYDAALDEKTIRFFGSDLKISELIVYYLLYSFVSTSAKSYMSFRNDLLASQGWLLCRLFAHKYPDVRVNKN